MGCGAEDSRDQDQLAKHLLWHGESSMVSVSETRLVYLVCLVYSVCLVYLR